MYSVLVPKWQLSTCIPFPFPGSPKWELATCMLFTAKVATGNIYSVSLPKWQLAIYILSSVSLQKWQLAIYILSSVSLQKWQLSIYILSYGVFTPEQDNDKTNVEPVHSYYAFHTGSDKPGVKGIIGMHSQVPHLSCRCLVVVLLWCENTITAKVATVNIYSFLLPKWQLSTCIPFAGNDAAGCFLDAHMSETARYQSRINETAGWRLPSSEYK